MTEEPDVSVRRVIDDFKRALVSSAIHKRRLWIQIQSGGPMDFATNHTITRNANRALRKKWSKVPSKYRRVVTDMYRDMTNKVDLRTDEGFRSSTRVCSEVHRRYRDMWIEGHATRRERSIARAFEIRANMVLSLLDWR